MQAADTTFNAAAAAAPPLPPGGIQIAGIARDIYVRYNEIEGGCGNGITLGGLMLVDGNGVQVNGYVGYNPAGGTPDPCSKGNIYYPGTVVFGSQNANVVVDGRLTDIHIENNRIRNMGLCGIGPIGFFDLGKSPEVVTVSGLWIVANEIADCLSRTLTQYTAAQSTMLGYGGICLPDVTLVVIRDNVILNTGATLADPVTGIFVLHGAQVEISRNQIQDTRDWTNRSIANAAPSGYPRRHLADDGDSARCARRGHRPPGRRSTNAAGEQGGQPVRARRARPHHSGEHRRYSTGPGLIGGRPGRVLHSRQPLFDRRRAELAGGRLRLHLQFGQRRWNRRSPSPLPRIGWHCWPRSTAGATTRSGVSVVLR